MRVSTRYFNAKRIIKLALLWTLVVPTVALFASIAAYDVAKFLPHRQQFDDIIAHASPEDVLPNDVFMRVTRVVDGEGATTRTVARALLTSSYPDRVPTSWHLDYALWNLLVALHLPSEQIEALYRISAVPGGCNSLSLNMFGTPLSELNQEQLMSVAVVIRSPKRYLGRPDLIDELSRSCGRRCKE